MQWIFRKVITNGSSGTVFSFPINFSTIHYSVTTGIGDNSTNNACFLKNFLNNSVTVFTNNNYGSSISIIAIGY